ncbi:hypothetical protein [Brumimicrobium oceani]|uniref:Uncharacterized protein n=1 Tax=Brumimicrobium oceani TaxID=2100725 RepID=A0A2U2XBZ1_9FLAO|nr:hypothetical protein [Brumimicrobium oceani]PWH85302.1 hypothetical protein DIT68_10210 [Brumimicrobium oceani]
MKYSLFFITVTFLFLSSCNKNSDNNRYYKDVDLSENPCEYLTKQMVLSHFGISTSKLELKNVYPQSSNDISQCGYFWEKSQDAEHKISNKKSEFANNHIKLGSFRKYKNEIAAERDFQRNYWISSNEDLKASTTDSGTGSYSTENPNASSMHYGVQGNYNSDFKLTEVFGIGDQAFYDHLNKSLDVRFGTISFSIFIETEYDTETNILIAKKLAKEVWEKL